MAVQNPEHLDIEAFGGITPFDRPTPGQSLTNDPDNKYPWEQAPRFTNVQDATLAILEDCYSKENFEMIALSLADDMPVGNLASIILQEGFNQGAWNPDLLMLLIEPTMYILMSIAEKCGIDYLLYEGDTYESYDEDDDEAVKQTIEDLQGINSQMKQTLNLKDLKPVNITKQSVPEEVLERIEEVQPSEEIISLLDRKKKEPNSSLLARE
tara:strand:- start:61 stop:693 length:633 start_codon:yes stop_codon:yes gene_type:complete